MKSKTTSEVSEELHKRQLGEEYTRKQLLEAVEDFFSAFDIAFISEHLTDLMIYAVNLDRAKDLEKEDVVSLVTDNSGIIRCLSAAYVAYEDYKSSKEKLSEMADEVA